MRTMTLRYDDADFAVRARKLITGRQTFSFVVVGAARDQLLPHVANGVIADPARLGLKPKLQVLVAILMLAEAQGQAVSFEISEGAVCVWVGVGKA